MRHEAAGITTAAFPKTIRLGGVDCSASYLHQPGDARDGVTVTVPIYALNQVSEERCEWLVPGMLKDKVHALLKSLHQKPRSRLVPLPEYAGQFVAQTPFAEGSLLQALLRAVREKTQLDVQRADFKLEQVPAHLCMNFRVVDEHGRQLAMGRNLPALKAELGGQARSAFQALAALKSDVGRASPQASVARPDAVPRRTEAATAGAEPAKYTAWTFGELPELMEIRRGAQTLVGFPALIDKGTHVEIEVFDEPDVAATKHRAGLRRLVALQLREPLKYLDKNIPELPQMAMAYMSLGSADELRAADCRGGARSRFSGRATPERRAQLQGAHRRRPRPIEPDRTRDRATCRRGAVRIRDSAAQVEGHEADEGGSGRCASSARTAVAEDLPACDATCQLQHLVRYLKGIAMRLDKWRADPQRDAQRMAEMRPLEQRYARALGRAQRRSRRAARGIPLAARGASHQPVCARAAHAAAGVGEAAGKSLGADVEIA